MKRPFGRALLFALSLSLMLSFAMQTSSYPAIEKESPKQAALHDAMRKLWEDHITWTRIFIISAAGDLPDKTAATDRLLQNQVDIGNAIKPYYGEAAGNKLTALLKEHITTAADVVVRPRRMIKRS